MNEEKYSRTEMLLGKEAMEKLKNSRVAVFGVGGVGGYVVEALARCMVGTFYLIDNDVVSISNINRQIIADESSIGKAKTEVMKNRILSINPEAKVITYEMFFLPENSSQIDFKNFDYVVDAVDTVSAKIEIILRAKTAQIPVISSMGTGNKLNPTMFEVSDIFKTRVDPLAKVMRHELKKRNINSLKVVYSREKPLETINKQVNKESGKAIPGSISFCPSVAGLIIASEVVKDITGIKNDKIGG